MYFLEPFVFFVGQFCMGYWFLIDDFLVKGMFDHFLLVLVKDAKSMYEWMLCLLQNYLLFSLRRAATLAVDFFFFLFDRMKYS